MYFQYLCIVVSALTLKLTGAALTCSQCYNCSVMGTFDSNCTASVACSVLSRRTEKQPQETIERVCINRQVVYDKKCNDKEQRNPSTGVISRYNCCNSGNFCNINLTLSPIQSSALSPSTHVSPSSTMGSYVSVSPCASCTSMALNNYGIYIPSILLPLMFIAIIVCCVTVLAYKIKKRIMTLPSLDHNSSVVSDPVSVAISDSITDTSGSGSGPQHLVPRTIARSITLGCPIGNGGFGQVYVGTFHGELYAVKKFTSRDEESWFRECQIYNNFNIRHETILSCFATDILSVNGVTELWLITQYHPNGSLFDVLNRDTLDLKTAISYAVSSCRGIAYLHTELVGTHGKPSVAHRDIKSKNILVKNDNSCCIADFGLAVVQNSNKPQNIRQGTKRYMAPEVLAETINVSNFESFLRTDMYSFGLVMWEIFCRCFSDDNNSERGYELPFHEYISSDPSFSEMRSVVVEQCREPQIPLCWAKDEVLKCMATLMTECWSHEPAARPTAFMVKKKMMKVANANSIKLNIFKELIIN